MSLFSTTVRATHLVTNAAWFGGSLAGATALNPASREGDSSRERAEIADRGWGSWGPIQGASIALHLVSGVAILADNRRRARRHRPTQTATVIKTVLTAAAVAGTIEAYRSGAALGEAAAAADDDSRAASEASRLSDRMSWLQWVTPATTGGLLVLDAYLGEQQRGWAGLIDPGAWR